MLQPLMVSYREAVASRDGNTRFPKAEKYLASWRGTA